MKNLILFLSFVTGCCTSCGNFSAPESKIVSVMDDQTGDSTIALTVEEIQQSLDITSSMFTGVVLRYSHIIDVDYSKVSEISLESEVELFSNENIRKRKIEDFNKKLEDIIWTDTAKYQNSSIWIRIFREYQELNAGGKKAQLIVKSDLMEHSDWISMYDESIVSKLKENPESIRKQFKEQLPEFKQNGNVEVVIVFQPRSQEQNRIFRLMINNIYKPIFAEYSIQLTTKANL